jgi:hypothetical protein
MEATPPDEPIKKQPPVPHRAKPASPAPVAAAPVEPEIDAAIDDEFDNEQESIRVLGAFALGLMALLLFCIIALLIAYRNVPEGL